MFDSVDGWTSENGWTTGAFEPAPVWVAADAWTSSTAFDQVSPWGTADAWSSEDNP